MTKVIIDATELCSTTSSPIIPIVKCYRKAIIISFKKNISFEQFCLFINMLYFPIFVKYNPNPIILGWTTLKENDKYITSELFNKRIMLYLPSFDEANKNDYIYFTTKNNISYCLDLDKECISFSQISTNFMNAFYSINIKNKPQNTIVFKKLKTTKYFYYRCRQYYENREKIYYI